MTYDICGTPTMCCVVFQAMEIYSEHNRYKLLPPWDWILVWRVMLDKKKLVNICL